jgi:hypothetical protein
MERAPTSKEEFILPYPPDPVVSKFRATWLASSLKAVRTRGFFDRYLENLPEQYRDIVLHAVAGEWLPVEVAVAHYAALDALALSEVEILAIGAEVNARFNSLFLQTVLRLAKGVGATPWTAFRQAQKMWDRTWVGGGYAIVKLGEREARGEVIGWPCARFRYTRVGMRGMVSSVTTLFCRRAWVQEIPAQCTDTRLAYKINWV